MLSACFCMALSNAALAQNDYIITLKNDTLRGGITKPLIGKHRFKETEESKPIVISEKNTKVYHRTFSTKEPETFVARALPNQSKLRFLQLHEQGEIQLYEFERTSPGKYGNVTVTSWYASKGDGLLLSIKTDALSFSRAEKESNFEQLLGDNPTLWARFKAEKSFSFDVLRNYIKLYNEEKKNTTTTK
ncbi:hypothetical protein SAMN04487898_103342 [Pedobacter sp. ok626]|nr:hypothetical protein SAMN04487898_103342 [Pedobacter sp. ok626]